VWERKYQREPRLNVGIAEDNPSHKKICDQTDDWRMVFETMSFLFIKENSWVL